jgi:hypothetical protein
MGEERVAQKFLRGKPEGRDHWGKPDLSGRIILRWIFRKCEGVVETERSGFRIGTEGGPFEYGNELSDSINARNFLIT